MNAGDKKPKSNQSARLRLRVTPAAESALRAGHPWLYAESIREQNREGVLGELAVVYDRKDQFLAIGLFDPESPLRLRVLHAGKPTQIDPGWWRQRLAEAVARRAGFDAETTGFRWIHGESDGWPGLVLDRYGSNLVLKLYTAAWLPREEEIVSLIREALNPSRILLRLSRNIQSVAQGQFQRADGQTLFGPPLEQPVVFLENGLRFEADLVRGQKTGFFLDQRENRQKVGTLAEGRDVLNVFSFAGGFSIYAARAGARSATDLDISVHALDAARRNFGLNRGTPAVSACQHRVVQADAFEWLKASMAREFDLIVLDPPSLAKREAERARAILAYAGLVRDALGRLRRRGVLVAASCSAHVSAGEFFDSVHQAVHNSGRSHVELATTRHPIDHPANFAEAEYLKTIYLQLDA